MSHPGLGESGVATKINASEEKHNLEFTLVTAGFLNVLIRKAHITPVFTGENVVLGQAIYSLLTMFAQNSFESSFLVRILCIEALIKNFGYQVKVKFQLFSI